MKRTTKPKPRRRINRLKNSAKYKLAPDAVIEYKNIPLLQKYITERGKIIPRRITGVTAKEQRQLTTAIKQARFLALLETGGVNK